MANWQQTYDQLKKRKKEIDNSKNASQIKQIDNAYKNTNAVNTIPIRSNITNNYVKSIVNNSPIVPVKEDKKWYQEIFSKGKFDDGYDFGDVTKTILGTGVNVGANAIKGVSDIGVSGAKLIAGGTAQVADWIGQDKWADKVRNRIAGKDEETNKKLKKYTPSGWLETADEKTDDSSILGETADEVASGVGYYAGMLAAQAVGVPWQVTAGVSSAGSELGNAYANDAKDWEAWLSSGISAGVEIGSEYLFSGVKLPGTGKGTDKVLGGVTEKIKNKGLKYLAEAGIQIGGEGIEEVLSGFGSAIGQKLTYMDDKELNELYSSEDALKDFVIGAAVSGIAMGANSNTHQNIKDGRSLMTGKTTEEAETIKKEADKRIKIAEQEGITLTTKEKNAIEEQVTNEVMNSQSTEATQQETETNTELNNISTQIQALENTLDTSQSAVQQQEILNKITELEQQYNAIQQQTQLPVIEATRENTQVQQEVAPIQSEVNQPTTQQTETNLTTEADSNTIEAVESPDINVESPAITEQANNQVSETAPIREQQVVNNELTEDLQTETTAPIQENHFTYKEYNDVVGKIDSIEQEIKKDIDNQYTKEREKLLKEWNKLLKTPDSEISVEEKSNRLSKLQSLLNGGLRNQYDTKLENTLNEKAKDLVTRKDELQKMFDKDWKEQFSKIKETKTQQEIDTTGKALDTIAPIKEELSDLTSELKDTIKDTKKELKALTKEINSVKTTIEETKALTETDIPMVEKEAANNLQSITDDLAPTRENTTPEAEDITQGTVESPLENRDIDEVGSKKIKAYQYENPEVRPYFRVEAEAMLHELQNTVKGERMPIYDEVGNMEYTGVTRETTDAIAYLKDNYNYSYAEIEKGLNAIIEDNGKENIAVAKRIEFLLDERLRDGYTSIDGTQIPPSQEYIDFLHEKQITEYNRELSQTLTDEHAPIENIEPVVEETTQDIAPVVETPVKEKYLAIEPNREAFDKGVMKRVKEVENDLGYSPKDPTKESTYLEDTSSETKKNQEIAKILDTEPKTEDTRNKRKLAIIAANVLDKGLVFENLSLKNKNRDLMGKWDYTLTSEARGQNVIGQGNYEYDPTTKTTKQISKSLNDIRAEVDNTGLTKQFYEYMYHKHNVDRMNLEERYEDVENKPVFGYDVDSAASQEIVNQYEFSNPEFMSYAQDVYDYLDADRQQLVKNGVISQETADLWQEMYPHYVPIRRVDSQGLNINVPLDTGRTGVNAPIKKATGGNTDILPLFDTMAQRTLQTYRATAKNSFGVELKNTLGTTIDKQQTNVDDVIDSIDNQEGLLQENNGKPTFTVFENGEKVTYSITQDMYDALKPLSDSSILSKTITPLNAVSSFHRGVLTQYNIFFAIRNGIKDIQDVLINSQHTAKTYSKIPEAWAQYFTKGYWYKEYIANGGEQNSYFDSQDNTFNPERKGIYKALDLPPLKQIAQLNDFIEIGPRLAEYIVSREMGRSVEVSMLDAARVTTNFKAGGNLTKFLNRNGATFLNASVQGAMQQVRNIREAKMNGVKGWASLATKFAVAGLPAVLLNGLLWDDDEEYEELSDYVKQNYYIVAKDDNGNFIRIPKGRTLAVIQNAIEQVSNASSGNDEVDLKEFLNLAVTNLAPNNPIENNIFSPIVQVAKNKTWYDGDLVPTRLQDLPAAEQYDESTDLFSRWFGETFNVSPMKVNYLLKQYSGGVGSTVLPMMTPEATNDADTLGEQLIAPLKSTFTTNATMNNKNVGDLYDKSEELTKNTKKSNATDEDILSNKYLNSVKGEMSELYKEKRDIQNSDLPKAEKYEQAKEIQERINNISRNGLNSYEDVNITGNYATAGDKQYKKNDEGEWQSINDEQIEKQEEVSNGLGISASEYWSNKEEYDYAYEKPKEYAVATAITDYQTYKTYNSDIWDLKADKDAEGKSISGTRKDKVISYVNGLDLSIPQKAMLIRQEYSSFDDYNNDIVNYVSNLDVDYDTKKSILEGLDMKVYSDGRIEW